MPNTTDNNHDSKAAEEAWDAYIALCDEREALNIRCRAAHTKWREADRAHGAAKSSIDEADRLDEAKDGGMEVVRAAADDSRKPSSADKPAFAVQRVDMPAARWREQAREARHAGERAKANGMEGLHRSMNGRALALEQCADEIEEKERDVALVEVARLQKLQDAWKAVNLPNSVPISYAQLLLKHDSLAADNARMRNALRFARARMPSNADISLIDLALTAG